MLRLNELSIEIHKIHPTHLTNQKDGAGGAGNILVLHFLKNGTGLAVALD